jgi:hypothetical protein
MKKVESDIVLLGQTTQAPIKKGSAQRGRMMHLQALWVLTRPAKNMVGTKTQRMASRVKPLVVCQTGKPGSVLLPTALDAKRGLTVADKASIEHSLLELEALIRRFEAGA